MTYHRFGHFSEGVGGVVEIVRSYAYRIMSVVLHRSYMLAVVFCNSVFFPYTFV